jgi:YD repeat-containing protein
MNYLRANIENALFSDVSSLTGGAEYNDSKLLWSNINSSVPNSLIKTYSYKPFVGMSSQTDQMGVTTYYYYDLFGRLSEVKNDDMKLLKKYNYRYVSN